MLRSLQRLNPEVYWMNVVEAQSSERTAELFATITALVPELAKEAASSDSAATFPSAAVARLREAGLLMAPVPVEFGGFGLHGQGDSLALFQLLHLLGYADLSLGRIFEAHVNALELIRQYGTSRQMEAAALAAQAGGLFALWVTDPAKHSVHLSPDFTLTGEKWFCSAAGAAKQVLITAQTEAGSQMVLVPITPRIVVTDRGVKLAGMRSAATGSVDFTGVVVDQEALIGQPGDYLREPVFSTGAWRSSAVALGGLAALIDTAKDELCSRGRADNPFQRMRFGQSVIAHETGRLWMLEAVKRIDAATGAGGEAVAYVNLARTAVEAACLDALRHIQRSLGLSAFMQGSGAERISRDLATYLRQPAPDEALVEAAGYFIHHGGRNL
jgi:alkylation response protein AidB-like acyl-CoA dehydrogenase